VTGFGILGIACMTFNVHYISTLDKNIGTITKILGVVNGTTTFRVWESHQAVEASLTNRISVITHFHSYKRNRMC